MLTIRELNDRSYDDIVDAAKEMIPHVFPAWTDLRAHDPGITFVELFAWLVKMLEDYQNVVTNKNRMKFLKLLNVRPLEPQRAETYITVEGKENVILPKGTKISGFDEIFETSDSICIKSVKIQSVYNYLKDKQQYEKVFTNDNKKNLGYTAFGKKADVGNAIIIGFDNINKVCGKIGFKVDLLKGSWSRNRKPAGTKLNSLALLGWEYLKDGEWNKIEVLYDETHGLLYDGVISLRIPDDFTAQRLPLDDVEELFYIRGVFIKGEYEIPPVIQKILPNTVKARHGDTLSEALCFSGNGKDKLVLEIDSYLGMYGSCEVMVRDADGFWYSWHEADGKTNDRSVYEINRVEKSMKTYIKFGKSVKGKVPAKEDSNILIVFYDENFEESREIFYDKVFEKSREIIYDKTSKKPREIIYESPLPNQTFRLEWAMNEDIICPGTFRIMVGTRKPFEKVFKWKEFIKVDDLLNSRGNDPHYVFDYKNKELIFGNNENGAMPGEFGENVIKIISCTLGGGNRGNVKESRLQKLCDTVLRNLIERKRHLEILEGIDNNEHYKAMDDNEKAKYDHQIKNFKYTLNNYSKAFGGNDGEDYDDTLKRALLDMKTQYRAVTLKDYENAALSTPGLMVARAKALSEFEKGMKNYPEKRSKGKIAVVVVPCSNEKMPMPGKRFMDIVKSHLQEVRLVTTEVSVIPPLYIGLEVSCTVVVMPHIRFREESVSESLNEFINPLSGKNYEGWPFGGSVRKGDITSRICEVNGIEYVKDIHIYVKDEEAIVDKSGDIIIPPYALVYLKSCDVEVISLE